MIQATSVEHASLTLTLQQRIRSSLLLELQELLWLLSISQIDAHFLASPWRFSIILPINPHFAKVSTFL